MLRQDFGPMGLYHLVSWPRHRASNADAAAVQFTLSSRVLEKKAHNCLDKLLSHLKGHWYHCSWHATRGSKLLITRSMSTSDMFTSFGDPHKWKMWPDSSITQVQKNALLCQNHECDQTQMCVLFSTLQMCLFCAVKSVSPGWKQPFGNFRESGTSFDVPIAADLLLVVFFLATQS